MRFKVWDIKWDTDGEDVNLPTELIANVELDGEYLSQFKENQMTDIIEAEISDYLSDEYGWCHLGFKYRKMKK